MQRLAAAACGVVFGAGLALSGMTNPAKVLAFLDVAGAWDPTLAFVMGGALAVAAAGFAPSRRRAEPRLAASFGWSPPRGLDGPPLGGGALRGGGGHGGVAPAVTGPAWTPWAGRSSAGGRMIRGPATWWSGWRAT